MNDIHERFCGAIQHRYFIRAHMSAMLALVLLSGVLAGGLARTARESHHPGWFGGVLKATAIPFAVVFVLSGVFGYEAHRLCPGSATARQVLRTCVS